MPTSEEEKVRAVEQALDDELDSPPFSPISPVIDRPDVPSRVVSDLRRACAIIVHETQPADFEDVPDHHEIMKKAAKNRDREDRERSAYKSLAQARTTKTEPQSPFVRAHHRNPSEPLPDARPVYTHIPAYAAKSFEATAAHRQQSVSTNHDSLPYEPLEPTHTKISSRTRNKMPESEDALYRIRAALESRPKTSAAACIDYDGPSSPPSNSTSRTNTTSEGNHRMHSTGFSSLVHTPGDDKRLSFIKKQSNTENLPEAAAIAKANAEAKAWMAEELSRRRAVSQSQGGVARPPSRSSVQHGYAEPERPASRAGSIIGGVIEYIRPSMDSSRSFSGLSRTPSRTSGRSNSWWRGANLKRKGSWASFRSARPGATEEPTTSDGTPNLNRALPALPGLDQYKEKKSNTHISQLMRAGGKGREKKSKQQASVPVEDDFRRTLAQTEERRRQQELQSAVEEKMKAGAISPTAERDNPFKRGPSYLQPLEGANRKALSISITEMSHSPKQTPKKNSLRKRLSRFWSAGSPKELRGKKESGKMVAAY